MNPDLADAIPKWVEAGVLPPERARLLLRVARRELVSVRGELRLLLYLGVLLVTGGVGLLVKENLERIGPAVIAAAIGLAAAAAFAWVARVAPPFSWRQVPSPHLGFEYALLLAVLLAAADLAYVEVEFTPLGAAWPWHLLIVALLAGLAAFRFDSPVVFALALSSFTAWRGVSAGRIGESPWAWTDDAVRWNAIACGALFAVLGLVLRRADRKAHFEPVAVHLGWLLILGGFAAGTGGVDWIAWPLYSLALLAGGAGLAAGAYRARRFALFAFGVIAGYGALSRVIFLAHDVGTTLGCFWFLSTSILLLLGLLWAQRRMREPL